MGILHSPHGLHLVKSRDIDPQRPYWGTRRYRCAEFNTRAGVGGGDQVFMDVRLRGNGFIMVAGVVDFQFHMTLKKEVVSLTRKATHPRVALFRMQKRPRRARGRKRRRRKL